MGRVTTGFERMYCAPCVTVFKLEVYSSHVPSQTVQNSPSSFSAPRLWRQLDEPAVLVAT